MRMVLFWYFFTFDVLNSLDNSIFESVFIIHLLRFSCALQLTNWTRDVYRTREKSIYTSTNKLMDCRINWFLSHIRQLVIAEWIVAESLRSFLFPLCFSNEHKVYRPNTNINICPLLTINRSLVIAYQSIANPLDVPLYYHRRSRQSIFFLIKFLFYFCSLISDAMMTSQIILRRL